MSLNIMNNKKILVIEDSQVCLALIKAYLRNTGARLMFACQGKDAWELFCKNRLDLVISDLSLPDMEGLFLLKKMKTTKPAVPLLIQTAREVKPSEIEYLGAGTYNYITKPYPQAKFIEKVVEALRPKGNFTPGIR